MPTAGGTGGVRPPAGANDQQRRGASAAGLVSLGPVLEALGVRLLLVEDREAVDRLAGRLETMADHARRYKAIAVNRTISLRFLREIGAKGGKASRASMSKSASSRLRQEGEPCALEGRARRPGEAGRRGGRLRRAGLHARGQARSEKMKEAKRQGRSVVRH